MHTDSQFRLRARAWLPHLTPELPHASANPLTYDGSCCCRLLMGIARHYAAGDERAGRQRWGRVQPASETCFVVFVGRTVTPNAQMPLLSRRLLLPGVSHDDEQHMFPGSRAAWWPPGLEFQSTISPRGDVSWHEHLTVLAAAPPPKGPYHSTLQPATAASAGGTATPLPPSFMC